MKRIITLFLLCMMFALPCFSQDIDKTEITIQLTSEELRALEINNSDIDELEMRIRNLIHNEVSIARNSLRREILEGKTIEDLEKMME